MSLSDYLDLMPVQGYGNSLTHLLKIAGIKAASSRKADVIRALDAYLSNEANIIKIWNILPPVEQELLEEFIRSKGDIEQEDIRDILEKHNVAEKKDRDHFGFFCSYAPFTSYFRELSPARLFFIGRGIPAPIARVLARFVRPLEPSYKTISDATIKQKLKKGLLEEVSIGESFAADCLNYIKLVNSTKLRTTKGRGLPTKAGMKKINDVLHNKEVLLHVFEMDDYRVVEQTARIFGLTRLLLQGEVLDEEAGFLTVGPEANEFLTLNTAGKCRKLLKDYINAEALFELERIRGARISVSYPFPLTTARETILKHLAKCPINFWVDISELQRAIRKDDRHFITRLVGEIQVYNSYERYYYITSSWSEVEWKYVDVVLLEYLSTLGIVDLMVTEDIEDYTDKSFLTVNYLRLTPLGAYVLGVNDDYNEPEEKMKHSGIIVQPNFEIVVDAGGTEAAHLLYLDRFGEKVSQGGVNVYKLSFKAIVNALDQGITVQELIEYFEEFSTNPVPENVLLTLKEWERESKRIRIRTVTILETDDPYLLAELKNYKTINKHILSDLPHVLEIDTKSANKLKREIEKKNRFCRIEDR